jgi:hypothetical protein
MQQISVVTFVISSFFGEKQKYNGEVGVDRSIIQAAEKWHIGP